MARKSNVSVDINDDEVRRMLEQMETKEIQKAAKMGMRRTLLIIRRGVQKELRSRIKDERPSRRVKTKSGYVTYGYLYKDVKVGIYRRSFGGNVSLLSRKGKQNRSHVLRFLNLGTQQRKKRGSIAGWHFFEAGVNATKDKAMAEAKKNLNQAIAKIYKKNR